MTGHDFPRNPGSTAPACSMSPLILLSPADNVAVCRRAVAAGELLPLDEGEVPAGCDLQLGHKVARQFIPCGAAVIKYGMSIGSATAAIYPGEWVHLHNLKGDYVSTHSRSAEAAAG